MIAAVFFGNRHLTFSNEPKVTITKSRMGSLKVHIYLLFEHLFYGFVEWDVMFKLYHRHSMYINRLSCPEFVTTKNQIPFHSIVKVGNVFGFQNLMDITFLAELHNNGIITHESIRSFIKQNYKYDKYKNN